LRGDLDAILAKALRKDVAGRYPGADALAQDLRRHLAGLPIEARPHGTLYLAQRFVRRHRAAVGALAAIVLALGAGLGVAAWQASVANAQERAAQRALERERAVRDMLVEILSVAVTADPARLREPDVIVPFAGARARWTTPTLGAIALLIALLRPEVRQRYAR